MTRRKARVQWGLVVMEELTNALYTAVHDAAHLTKRQKKLLDDYRGYIDSLIEEIERRRDRGRKTA